MKNGILMLAILLMFMFSQGSAQDMEKKENEYFVYVGTYTMKMGHVDGKADGILVYKLNKETGELTFSSKIDDIVNPAFLDIDPQNRFLYAANEIGDFDGTNGGGLSAFAINPATGSLRLLNQQPTNGAYPCHVNIDKTGKYVYAANYGGGSITVFPIQKDGSVGPASDLVKHEGSSVNKSRQEAPHAHSLMIDAANQVAYAADLGIDKVMMYRLDLENGTLKPNSQPYLEVAAGAGPRHSDFHPNGKYFYVINELNNTISVFAANEKSAELGEIQTITTLPSDFEGGNSTADIHVHPSGKFLYGSNRGHNSIAVFSIDETSGKLSPVEHESTQGDTPRNFTIDPSGKFLLAANQDTDTVVSFWIHQETGELISTGHMAEIPTPVCLKIISL